MENPFDPGFYRTPELRRMGFKSIGENVRISRDCHIWGLENISIGNHVRIDSGATLIGCGGWITLGDYIHIGGRSHLAGRGGIEIGDMGGTSQNVHIYSASDDYTGRGLCGPMIPVEYTRPKIAPVRFGKFPVIGSGAVILPGVECGDGVAIGALSVVTKSQPEFSVCTGNPAKRVMARSRRLEELEAEWMAQGKAHHSSPAACAISA